jgi:hypothetical protein
VGSGQEASRRLADAGTFVQFFKAVKKAEAEKEAELIDEWSEQTPRTWKAAKEFLACRFPERWGAGKEELKAIREEIKRLSNAIGEVGIRSCPKGRLQADSEKGGRVRGDVLV